MADKKKLTVMVFGDNGVGEVRTKHFSYSSIKIFVSAAVSLIIISVMISVGFFKLFYERNMMGKYKKENEILKLKVDEYAVKMDDIKLKLANIDQLEKQVRDLSALVSKNNVKGPAIGGKEKENLKGMYIKDIYVEKEANNIKADLDKMGGEIEKREAKLAKLVDLLEEKNLAILSTPSVIPVNGWFSSGFGMRKSPFSNKKVFHEGVDISAKYGAGIKASAKGIVIFSGYKPDYGKVVVIDHGYGYMTKYAHNSELLVKVGEKIKKGQLIAKVGDSGRSTGPHCHFEVLVNGVPVDPMKFIGSINISKR